MIHGISIEVGKKIKDGVVTFFYTCSTFVEIKIGSGCSRHEEDSLQDIVVKLKQAICKKGPLNLEAVHVEFPYYNHRVEYTLLLLPAFKETREEHLSEEEREEFLRLFKEIL